MARPESACFLHECAQDTIRPPVAAHEMCSFQWQGAVVVLKSWAPRRASRLRDRLTAGA